MVLKEALKPQRLASRIDELRVMTEDVSIGSESLLLKNQRALLDLWLETTEDIRVKKIAVAHLREWLGYCSLEESLTGKSQKIATLERMMDQKYFKHHGRATEKHLLIREQEAQIRILRRKVVHQGNSLAAEKMLIKELQNVEETRAKILANGLEYIQYRQEFNSIEDIENQIKICKAEMTQLRKNKYVQTLMCGNIHRSDKDLRIMKNELTLLEEELKKINEIDNTTQLRLIKYRRDGQALSL